MSNLFGGMTDNKAAEERILKQEAKLKKQEAQQAKELASRRKLAGRGAASRTLFSQVLGIDASKKTDLGG